MDFTFLEQPFDKRDLSELARRGVGFARTIENFKTTPAQIARDYGGLGDWTAAKICRAIDAARREITRPDRDCEVCGEPLREVQRSTKRFCDARCRVRAHRERVRRDV